MATSREISVTQLARDLLTFDRKHLLDQPQIAENSGVEIITPGDLLQLLRNTE